MVGLAHAQVSAEKMFNVKVGDKLVPLLVLKSRPPAKLFESHLLVETFNEEHGTSLKVVPPKVADAVQMAGGIGKRLPEHPVDEFIAFEKPGIALGKEIVFEAYCEPKVVLPTGKYAGKKDIALVALDVSSKDFVKDGDALVLDVPDSRLKMVSKFPGGHGWYPQDDKVWVPHGRKMKNVCASTKGDPRYLWRANNSSYAGFLVRGSNPADVCAYYSPSANLGVVALVPEADVAKIEALLPAHAASSKK
jgi:hypothetical protein